MDCSSLSDDLKNRVKTAAANADRFSELCCQMYEAYNDFNEDDADNANRKRMTKRKIADFLSTMDEQEFQDMRYFFIFYNDLENMKRILEKNKHLKGVKIR